MPSTDGRSASFARDGGAIGSGLLPVLAALVLLIAAGCSSTKRVSYGDYKSYTAVNAAAQGETAHIRLRDGQLLILNGLVVGPDSASGWTPTGNTRTFPTRSIRTVTLTRRGAGFWQGAGIGSASMIAVGLIGSSLQETEISADLMKGGGLVLSLPAGLVGGIFGGALGAGTEARTVYRFSASPRADPSP